MGEVALTCEMLSLKILFQWLSGLAIAINIEQVQSLYAGGFLPSPTLKLCTQYATIGKHGEVHLP